MGVSEMFTPKFMGFSSRKEMIFMKRFIAAILILVSIMYAEYRYIMVNINPYLGDNGTVYLEIFEQVDEYYAEPASEMR